MARGKRAGQRRRQGFRPEIALLAAGITLTLVAWGYLVVAAIDVGAAARSGEGGWGWLALSAVGAVACLFVTLMLVARLLRALGITRPPE
ncbi:hypothetical protein [Nocardioides nanhaiensis]|uniref:Uncharacterized protein n=1 Tax=Nocardioides nanhaiensis TaxID=1476871 RepID=A0ABP8W6X2_9ACTN